VRTKFMPPLQRIGGAVARWLRRRHSLLPSSVGTPRGGLFRLREANVVILPTPRRRATIDSKAGRLGDASPWVAVGGMEPSAPQIESHTRDIICPSSPSDPRCRLKHQSGKPTRRQAPRRVNASSDYDDVRASTHLLILSGLVGLASSCHSRKQQLLPWIH
jgi:hypothetical protein